MVSVFGIRPLIAFADLLTEGRVKLEARNVESQFGLFRKVKNQFWDMNQFWANFFYSCFVSYQNFSKI